jgi:hypothetical protein
MSEEEPGKACMKLQGLQPLRFFHLPGLQSVPLIYAFLSCLLQLLKFQDQLASDYAPGKGLLALDKSKIIGDLIQVNSNDNEDIKTTDVFVNRYLLFI